MSSSPDLTEQQGEWRAAADDIQREVGGAPTSNDTVDCLLKVFCVDGRVQMSGGDERCLVAHVGNVST